MGCALKYGHGWLTSVEVGWTKEKDIYNIRDFPIGEGGGKVSRKREELGIHILGRGVLSPWDVGPSDSVFWAPIWSSSVPNQAVTPSEPNFWTHSLQIHCNGAVGPRSCPSLGPVRKQGPYNRYSELPNNEL